MWYFELGGMVLWRGGVVLWSGWCETLKRVVWYFQESGVVLWRGGVVLWIGWYGTLKRWCGTLKRVVWNFEEGGVVHTASTRFCKVIETIRSTIVWLNWTNWHRLFVDDPANHTSSKSCKKYWLNTIKANFPIYVQKRRKPLQSTTPPSSKYHTSLFKVPHLNGWCLTNGS